ncbi:MAG TPA: response regulator [Allocoleopsis sp.]
MQSDPKVNILLVDDHAENLLALEAILSRLGENLIKAYSGEEALRCLLDQDFAVILLDVQMPGMSGFETADLIRSRARSRQTPIIFLTAFSTTDDLVFKGYSLGAVDYLQKPIDPTILTSKVSVFVDLFRKTEMLKQQAEKMQRQAAQLTAMNQELRQSEERFRLLSMCSPLGVFMLDTQGQCTYANPRGQAICDFSLDHPLEQTWQQWVQPEDRDRVLSGWAVYIQTGQEYSDEFRLITPETDDDTEQWVHVRSARLLSPQNELLGHVGTIEDITERKQMEATRNQMIREQVARREAEAASRMKDEFLAVLSHELRTPLNSMLGWAKLLRTRKFDEETTERALETIERNATAQAQLIEDILDVSKIIRGKLRLNRIPINLVSIIEAAIDAVRPQADAKSLQLIAHLNSLKGQVWGDPVRLQQVVWNLLSNAIKFTPEGGQVEVRLEERAYTNPTHLCEIVTTNHQNGKEQFLVEAMRHQPSGSDSCATHYAQIQVIDTGIGIQPGFLPNVFDRFRQADSTTTRSHNGLGLGLAIVHHLVELHQGSVTAESLGEGHGSTFTVSLPIGETPRPILLHQGDLASAASEPQSRELEGVKVLLVEDEADTREFLNFVLRQYGATTTTTASVAEALDRLPEVQPHLLISDIGMPEQDGYMLIHQIRVAEETNHTYLPAIALTAYSSLDDQRKALSAGFDAHLSKPVEVNELVETMNRLLGEVVSPLQHWERSPS